MLRDERVSSDGEWAANETGDRSIDPRQIDRALRRIARVRAGLDAEEASWLRLAERHKIWRRLGFATAYEYLERVFGYAPRTAQERLRVASALGSLPAIETALRDGELAHSAVRELTRVATPVTEHVWLERTRGMNLRDVEELVAGHAPGDLPDDPIDPDRIPHVLRFQVKASTFALFRQARAGLETERGGALDDDAVIEAMCRAVLGATTGASEQPSRPMHQVEVTRCDRCRRGWQDGAGVRVELTRAEIERATCDAQEFRSVEGEAPTRAVQTIPTTTRRKVWRRDHGRCRVPGCRAARNLDVHHIVHRADGGGHDPSNLVVLCSAHHRLVHEGRLTLSGTAPDTLGFHRLADGADVATRSDTSASHDVATTSEHATLATRALVQDGFAAMEARRAVTLACAHVGATADLEAVIREALRRLL